MEKSEDYYQEIENLLSKFKGGNVTLEINSFQNGLATLYFENPPKKNALSGKMLVEFRKCIEELEKWENGKALLIYSGGNIFCSGGDLKFASAINTKKQGRMMADWMQDALLRLQKLPLFSVTLIQGPALGGGAELAVYTDFIVASSNAKIGFVHGKMGISTAWGGTTRLVQKIGSSKALDILLSSEILSVEKCLDLGIINIIVDNQKPLEATLKWIKTRMHAHYSVTRNFKTISCDANEAVFEKEKELFSNTWGSSSNKEALKQKIKHIKLNND